MKRFRLPFIAAAAAALAIGGCGCAMNSPRLVETTRTTSGTNVTETRRELRMPTVALWPATSTLESQRASLGKTFSVGTSGVREDGGGTNTVETLVQLNRLLGR